MKARQKNLPGFFAAPFKEKTSFILIVRFPRTDPLLRESGGFFVCAVPIEEHQPGVEILRCKLQDFGF